MVGLMRQGIPMMISAVGNKEYSTLNPNNQISIADSTKRPDQLQQILAEFLVAPISVPFSKSPRTHASLSPNQFTNRRSQRMQSATTWGDTFSPKMFEKIAQRSLYFASISHPIFHTGPA